MKTTDGERGYSPLEPSDDYPEYENKIAGGLRTAKLDRKPVGDRPDDEN